MGPIGALAITRHMVAKLPYDIERDFQPIALVTRGHLLLAVSPKLPVNSVKELIDYAKKNPGKIHYGTVGNGSYPHYDMAYFAKRAGDLDMSALPNKNGASGVIQDMLRGDVQAAFLNVGSSAGMVQSGKFRPLALVNNTRLPEYPNVPTMKEVGYADVGTLAWNALFAPAATPKPVLDALYAIVAKAIASPDVQEKFKKQNYNIVPSKSVADAQSWLAAEMKHWETVTSAVKIDVGQ